MDENSYEIMNENIDENVDEILRQSFECLRSSLRKLRLTPTFPSKNLDKNVDENVDKNIDELLQQSFACLRSSLRKLRLTPTFSSKNVDENMDENVDEILRQSFAFLRSSLGKLRLTPTFPSKNMNENIDENVDKNMDENVDKNVDENVDKNVNKNVNKNMDENVDKNIDENVDKNIDEANTNIPFTVWMIVYTPSEIRDANYNHLNKIHPINKFVAIDSVSNFQKYSDLAIEKGYNTPGYMNSIRRHHPGKLGCNLSHQLLVDEISEKSLTEWNLVLEDDTLIHIPMLLKEVQPMLHAATKNGSKYIQLYTHPKFITEQRNREKVGENLYDMLYQWGTCAYFIHKDAIPKMKEAYPMNVHVDHFYSSLISPLKSLCWLTPYVKTLGELGGGSRYKTQNIGSIIMSIEAPRDFSVENAYAEFDEFLRQTVAGGSTV